MVEAIVPRDRNGLVLRLLILTALLCIGAGTLFKATQSSAASNDFVVSITDSDDPVAAGSSFTKTVSIADGAGPLVTPGFLTVYLTFQNNQPNAAQVGSDYTVVDPTDANWTCNFLVSSLVG